MFTLVYNHLKLRSAMSLLPEKEPFLYIYICIKERLVCRVPTEAQKGQTKLVACLGGSPTRPVSVGYNLRPRL